MEDGAAVRIMPGVPLAVPTTKPGPEILAAYRLTIAAWTERAIVMIKVLDAAAMQACDRAAIDDYGIAGDLLMENAGLQVVEALADHFDDQPPATVAVLCGRGNNGGDGFVVARHLHNMGTMVAVYLFGPASALRDAAASNHRVATAVGVPVTEVLDEEAWARLAADLADVDCIVDAMLGTGLDSAARGVIAAAIESVNDADVPVVAVDVPSGLSADSAAIPGAVVEAVLTVAFAAPKVCHVLTPARETCGDVVVADIGLPEPLLEAAVPSLWLPTPEDCAAGLPLRWSDSHKGDYGRVVVIGGAPGTAGAAVLAARGALRGGGGLVHVLCPETAYLPIACQLVEALVHPVPAGDGGGLSAEADEAAGEVLAAANAVAIGPGVGTSPETVALVRRLAVDCTKPMVIDADGLNALVGVAEGLREAAAPRVLTPHPGEAARLLGVDVPAVQADRVAAATELAEKTRAVVLLKGHDSLTVDPGCAPVVNMTGNPGMATGGTGDVLTGLIAALIAQGLRPCPAAWTGAWLHGLAGDLAAARVGQIGCLATDLADELPRAFAAVEPEEES